MNPNQILHDIYALIDKGLINDAFAKIAEIYGKVPPFADLQGEYIAGKDNAKFTDRLKTYASHIAQTQTPLQQKINTLEAELDALKHTEERLTREKQTLDKAKNEALNDYEEAHTKVLQQERALKQKQAEIESLKNQLTNTQQNPRLQTELEEKEEQIQALKTTIKNLKEGLLAYEKLQKEHTTLQERLTAIEQAEAQKKAILQQQKDLEFTIAGVSCKMIYVEGGTFQMGSNNYNDEKPIYPVTLTDFYMGETPVTQALYEAVMKKNPSKFKGANLPVEKVSWHDAQAFIARLNEVAKPAVGVWCLPTEAQWEYAARGGKKSKGYKFAGNDDVNNVAWYDKNSGNTTHAVAGKWSNELGLYDMSGNVWEWCADDYDKEAYAKVKPDMKNPVCIEGKILEYDVFLSNNKNRANNSNRLLRGGSWLKFDLNCRVAYRNSNLAGYTSDGIGFRLSIIVTQ